MTRPVIAIRPEPGLSATLSAGRSLGLDIHGFPLFRIAPIAWQVPDPANIDGLLLGSANALRHGGDALGRYAGKPAWCVGETTARVAQAAGLTIAGMGQGGLQGVLDQLEGQQLNLLRLAGREHVPLTAPAGVSIETRIVYGSEALPMPGTLADMLKGGAVVLLHSAVAASHFAAECDRHGLAKEPILLATLGPRISAAAGEGWGAQCHADTPREAALLPLAQDMCQ